MQCLQEDDTSGATVTLNLGMQTTIRIGAVLVTFTEAQWLESDRNASPLPNPTLAILTSRKCPQITTWVPQMISRNSTHRNPEFHTQKPRTSPISRLILFQDFGVPLHSVLGGEMKLICRATLSNACRYEKSYCASIAMFRCWVCTHTYAHYCLVFDRMLLGYTCNIEI